jgi:hypothetical protein
VRAFDLIVIGAGSGNSIVDERFAHQRVAILDNGRRFGGTCLNYGCIPTKMFVLPPDLLASPADAARVGVPPAHAVRRLGAGARPHLRPDRRHLGRRGRRGALTIPR